MWWNLPYEGFGHIENDLSRGLPNHISRRDINLVEHPMRRYSAWIGRFT